MRENLTYGLTRGRWVGYSAAPVAYSTTYPGKPSIPGNRILPLYKGLGFDYGMADGIHFVFTANQSAAAPSDRGELFFSNSNAGSRRNSCDIHIYIFQL
jgi:hypothetical protein